MSHQSRSTQPRSLTSSRPWPGSRGLFFFCIVVGQRCANTLPFDHLLFQAMPQCKPLPPLAEVQKAFNYDPDTGVITHAYTRGRARAGSEAGHIQPKGYRTIGFKGAYYRANRLAWLLGHGSDPVGYIVEHENLDKLDNRLSNLRLATDSQNQWNRICRGWFISDGRFVVRFSRGGVRHYVGSFGTAEEAEKAYRKAKVDICGDFAPKTYK